MKHFTHPSPNLAKIPTPENANKPLKYQNSLNHDHDALPRIGVLMVNLGTPDAPTRKALKKYLKEFLSDPRVVEPTMWRWIWWLILNGIILNVRPARSAKAYQSVWDHLGEGSPLLSISQRQQTLLQDAMNSENLPVQTILAMRYGNPSVKQGLQTLKDQGVRHILVLPLYPQYSATTTASVFDAVTKELQSWRQIPELRFINHYHDHPAYIEALAQSVRNHWQEHGQPEQLLMSFHGIPKRYWNQGDPYHCECQKTGRLLAESLGISQDKYQVVFQSIFGREEWLQPYAKNVLEKLARSGTKHVQVICPGFAADCLETLEEIQEEHRDYYLEAGGSGFSYIPALNELPDHIRLMRNLIKSNASDWIQATRNQTAATRPYQSFKEKSTNS